VNVRALLFASLQDAAGTRFVDEDLADGSTVADLSLRLTQRFPALEPRLPKTRVAVNDALAAIDHVLKTGDEVAYLPPVSGGSSDDVTVTDDEISLDAVLKSARRNDCGAVVLFLGTVRDSFQGMTVSGMEYEAHKVLAEHSMRDIVDEVRVRWPVKAVKVVHRVGRLGLGDVSVAVAVAAPHRPAAFEAARHVIDRLKEITPIWKREFTEDGEVWIEGDERIARPSS
jgi:molybdopterin synthase catalytic subunit/molybdopterin converting factor small subunit